MHCPPDILLDQAGPSDTSIVHARFTKGTERGPMLPRHNTKEKGISALSGNVTE